MTDVIDVNELVASLQQRLQVLEDERDVRTVTTRMATLADRRAWDELTTVFTPTVRADWSALSGVPGAEVPATDLIAGWRAGLAGLTATQHLVANQDITVHGDQATDVPRVRWSWFG